MQRNHKPINTNTMPTDTPPPCTPDSDGTGDTALLRAISANPECARILAEIAEGGDARQLIAQFIDPPEDAEPADATPDNPPEVAMYQTEPAPTPPDTPDSCPGFLAHVSPDFWEGF